MRSATALASPCGIPAARAKHKVLPLWMCSTAFAGVVSLAAYCSFGVWYPMDPSFDDQVVRSEASASPMHLGWPILAEICKGTGHAPTRMPFRDSSRIFWYQSPIWVPGTSSRIPLFSSPQCPRIGLRVDLAHPRPCSFGTDWFSGNCGRSGFPMKAQAASLWQTEPISRSLKVLPGLPSLGNYASAWR